MRNVAGLRFTRWASSYRSRTAARITSELHARLSIDLPGAEAGLRPVVVPAYADVALPVPLDQPFTYALPETLRHRVKPGCRLIVPFGSRKLTGMVRARPR